jgi:hypothetical protein
MAPNSHVVDASPSLLQRRIRVRWHQFLVFISCDFPQTKVVFKRGGRRSMHIAMGAVLEELKFKNNIRYFS